MWHLGRILALAAMVASLVNAQCALACALETASHACCPQHTTKPDRSGNNACPHPSSAGSQARIEVSAPILAVAPDAFLPAAFEAIPLAISPGWSGGPPTGASPFTTVRRI